MNYVIAEDKGEYADFIESQDNPNDFRFVYDRASMLSVLGREQTGTRVQELPDIEVGSHRIKNHRKVPVYKVILKKPVASITVLPNAKHRSDYANIMDAVRDVMKTSDEIELIESDWEMPSGDDEANAS